MIVFGMGADPEPRDRITLQQPECSPTNANPHGVDWFCIVNSAERKTRMLRMLAPALVVTSDELTYFVGKLTKTSDKAFRKLRFQS
jgi:hypothetical protein